MSLQNKLRIFCVIAIRHKDEHENVISIIATHLPDDFFSEKLVYSVGERKKNKLRKLEERKRGESWTNRPPLCLFLAPKKKTNACLGTAEFFKLAWSICEELSF